MALEKHGFISRPLEEAVASSMDMVALNNLVCKIKYCIQ